ncbi:MAG: D-lyxose/D-mannose family sugar isomerase [Victivallales bacterium]
MKRSEVNSILRDAVGFLEESKFRLPPFAYWTPADWTVKGPEADEIRDNLLGWDITDFGTGDFRNCGLVLFTLRNGNIKNLQYRKPYAEKIMIIEEEQRTPMHFHFNKMEDIINRGGGTLLLELYNSTGNGLLDKEKPVRASSDGVEREFVPGETIRLAVGESITLPPYLYHSFYAEKGRGTVLSGEVSMVNDDATDNRFLEPMGRFPEIEENEPVLYYLCSEYPRA